VQPLHGVEHAVLRHHRAGRPVQQRTHRPQRPPLGREDLLDVPGQRPRQREQPQRLAGGRAVDDDEVPEPGVDLLAQREQRQHLLRAGQHGELLGLQRVDAGAGQHVDEVALDVAPGALEGRLRVDLHAVQPGVDLGRRRPSGTPSASASECAGSVDSTSVLRPRAAATAAVAAEAVVLPTPPLPVKSRTRTRTDSSRTGRGGPGAGGAREAIPRSC
jgi:hypothetical protein